MEKLIYQSSPVVTFATNQFVNVPIILQFDDTPLISVVREQSLGFTTEIPIYHSDGTYLAKIRGTRPFPTEAGKKSGVNVRQLSGVTVCEVDGRTAFEIYHESGDAFRTHAELHTPNGYLVKCANGAPAVTGSEGRPLQIGGLMLMSNLFSGCRIGIWLKSNGSCAIGVG